MARFIHFMPVDSPIFNGEFIKRINAMDDIGEHLFLISGKSSLKSLEGTSCDNVRYEPEQGLPALRRYSSDADIIVLHSLALSVSDIRHLERKLARKIVWCCWGHDLYLDRTFKKISVSFKRKVADFNIRNFRAIVAGFKYDEIEIRKLFGSRIPVYNALYTSGYFRDDIDLVVQNHTRTDMRLNVMVGHSGYAFLQHIKQLDRLATYKDRDFVITLVLSYGEQEYVEQVIRHALAIFGEEKVRIITDFLSWKEYVDLLCDVDIAILDFERQAAFGNLILLAHLGKKLYLSPSGIMNRAFKAEGIATWDCSQIGHISFDAFSRLDKTPVTYPYIESLLDNKHIENQWKKLFQILQ